LDVVYLIDLPSPFESRTAILAFLEAMRAHPDRENEQIQTAIKEGNRVLRRHDQLASRRPSGKGAS
jgi:hypothetical protein